MEEQRRERQRRIVRLRIAALGAAATLMVIAAVVEPQISGAGLVLYGLVGVQMLIILGSLVLELVRTNASTQSERRLLQI